MIKVIIDNIAFYLQKSGGISVVWYELISRLEKEFINTIKYVEYKKTPQNIFYRKLHISNNQKIKTVYNKISRYLPLRLSKIKEKFIFHSSYYRYSSNPNAINITTVHDFTYEYFAKGLTRRIHSWQKKRAIIKSEYVICISENTKKDLFKFIPESKSKNIKVIYNGVSNDYYVLPHPVKSKIPYPNKKFVVFVGNRDGYKNFDFTVSTFSNFNYPLVIVGSPLTKRETYILNEKLGHSKYYYAGRVSNEELNVIYNTAFALFYPSSYEGFGIPILEAQKAGCPVVAYNTSSIPEVIGESPLLLQELTLNECKRVFCMLENEHVRKEICELGLNNAKRFTWDNMYKQVLDLYKEIDSDFSKSNENIINNNYIQ